MCIRIRTQRGESSALLTWFPPVSPRDRLSAYIRSNVAFIEQNRVSAVAVAETLTGYRSPEDCVWTRPQPSASPPTDAQFADRDPEAIFADGVSDGQFRPLPAHFMKNALRAVIDGAVWELAPQSGLRRSRLRRGIGDHLRAGDTG